MMELTTRQVADGLRDFLGGVRDWRLWHFLAWQEIKQRYRRSTLGPLWMSINLGIQMATMGLLVSTLFGHAYGKFLPYVCAGFIVWNFLSGIIVEGANCFVSSSSFILQINRPYHSYVLLVIWRNVIILWHNLIVLVVVLLIFLVPPTWNVLWLVVSLPLSILSVSWAALLLATLSARFRDIPLMLQNAMTVLFWLTPIIYYLDQLGRKAIILQFNPLTHLVEILRGPMLGTAPSLVNWLVSIGIAVIGWTVAIIVFARFRSRIPYWL